VFCLLCYAISGLTCEVAEFRGPGVHHNFDDSDSGYDVDMDQKKPFGGNQRGRIILLGDGTEVLTDSDDTEMFDHSEEDKDLASQVNKGQATSEDEPKPPTQKTEPNLKAAADGVLPKSTETTEKKADEKST
jgi:protein phosphatase 2C family protein 2/3